MKTVGFIGWRGMVGSVLLDRMREEGDFAHLTPVFFTTSQAGQPGPDVGQGVSPLLDASDIDALSGMDILVSCQGGDYTKRCILNCVPRVGRDTGWTPPVPCVWRNPV